MTNKSLYKAILFDFYDVIYADAFKRWLMSKGLKREGALQQASLDLDMGVIDAGGFRQRLADITGSTARKVNTELENFHILNDEILPLLAKLGKNYQIGLLSNASSASLRARLQKHSLEPYFHHIVISSEVGMIKPNPDIFEHLLSKIKVSPDEGIFIDDNEKNVQAAEKLGLTGIVYTGMPALYRDLDALGIIT